MDKINFLDKIKKVESSKLRDFVDAWVRGWRESSESREFRNFWRRSMI